MNLEAWINWFNQIKPAESFEFFKSQKLIQKTESFYFETSIVE
jgi:hypothetical protein